MNITSIEDGFKKNRRDVVFDKFVEDVMAFNSRTEELTANEKVFLKNRFNEGKKADAVTI